jgi:hypothetical protein
MPSDSKGLMFFVDYEYETAAAQLFVFYDSNDVAVTMDMGTTRETKS